MLDKGVLSSHHVCFMGFELQYFQTQGSARRRHICQWPKHVVSGLFTEMFFQVWKVQTALPHVTVKNILAQHDDLNQASTGEACGQLYPTCAIAYLYWLNVVSLSDCAYYDAHMYGIHSYILYAKDTYHRVKCRSCCIIDRVHRCHHEDVDCHLSFISSELNKFLAKDSETWQ